MPDNKEVQTYEIQMIGYRFAHLRFLTVSKCETYFNVSILTMFLTMRADSRFVLPPSILFLRVNWLWRDEGFTHRCCVVMFGRNETMMFGYEF